MSPQRLSQREDLHVEAGAGTTPGVLLTVVVPCFNEKDTILDVLDEVRQLPLNKVVLVVDNNSTDGTRELLRANTTATNEPSADCGLRPISLSPEQTDDSSHQRGQEWRRGDGFWVLLQPVNRGKGASVRTGLALARSKYVVCQDADREYDPTDIPRLVAMAEEQNLGAVFGSRLWGAAARRDSYHWGRVGLSTLFRWLYDTPTTDVATCYKLLRTDIARQLGLVGEGFSLDFEIAAQLRRAGVEIAELPISYRPRSEREGKKLRWRDGVSATWTLLKLRLARRPPERETASFLLGQARDHAQGGDAPRTVPTRSLGWKSSSTAGDGVALAEVLEPVRFSP